MQLWPFFKNGKNRKSEQKKCVIKNYQKKIKEMQNQNKKRISTRLKNRLETTEETICEFSDIMWK